MEKHKSMLPYAIRWLTIRKIARWFFVCILFAVSLSSLDHGYKGSMLIVALVFLLVAEIRFLYYYTSMSYCAHCLRAVGRDKNILDDCVFNEAQDEYYHGPCYRAISAIRNEGGK